MVAGARRRHRAALASLAEPLSRICSTADNRRGKIARLPEPGAYHSEIFFPKNGARVRN
jgi:hypothetical protein